jgi:hypothetical protein
MNISAASQLSLSSLRPPFARSALVLFSFTGEGQSNSGITVQMEAGEPAVAPGTGSVLRIYAEVPKWNTNNATLQRTPVFHVLIDHGNQVNTLVAGMSNVSVQIGQTVYRGDSLGSLLTNHLFCRVTVGRKALNPTSVNSHWLVQNSNMVTGQGGKIRFAPDRIARDLSGGVLAVLNSGIRYFKQLTSPTPLLINLAFNGDGSKAGLGATGYAADDYWNVYTPTDFLATAETCSYTSSYTFYSFSALPVLTLNDYSNTLSPVVLERVAPLFSAAGSGSNWDNMLKAWVGGYSGPIPYENTFRFRNLVAGTYDLYLYADQGIFPAASTFYASVGVALPTALSNNPSGTTVFGQNVNYVKFSLTVPASSYITFKVVGYLSGVQLQRT